MQYYISTQKRHVTRPQVIKLIHFQKIFSGKTYIAQQNPTTLKDKPT